MKYRYIGGPDQWHPGIPARDLTDEEVKRWPEVEKSPFYTADAAPAPVAPPSAGAGNVLESADE